MKSKFKEFLRKMIFLVSLVCIVISSIYIYQYVIQHIKTDQNAKELLNVYNGSALFHENTNLPKGYLSKFSGLYERNSDIKGWISVPNTKINFPVLQSNDNDYYLNRNFEKKYDPHGIPYADFRVQITQEYQSSNTVLYAHNINGGKLFGDFNKYRKSEFFKESPIIDFDTVYAEGKYKVYAAFITDINMSDPNFFDYHNYIDFKNKDEFNKYIDEINKRRLYDSGVDIKYGDKLLTFSTCANELTDGRMVVVARKVRPNESLEIDNNLVKENSNVLYPKEWIRKFGK